MKIVCVIHALSIGGMERVMTILCNHFSQMNHEVHVILIGRKRVVEYKLNSDVIIHKPKFDFDKYSRFVSTAKTVFFLRRTISKIKPDTILSFGEIWNNLVLIALIGKNNNLYISDRSQPNKNLGKFHNFLRNKLYPKASGFIAQTLYAKENAVKNKWSKNIKIIGNPIREIKTDGYKSNANTILFVGRLLSTKNVDALIKIFQELNLSDWNLIICGGNTQGKNQIEDLQNLCFDLGIEKTVSLLGAVNDVDKFYKQASIFAFPSSSEGFPNALGEALSAGIPSVAFDCIAGPSDLIDNNKNGFLVENNDFDGFKRAIKILVENNALRNEFSANAKNKIKKFNERNICNEFLNFISSESSN